MLKHIVKYLFVYLCIITGFYFLIDKTSGIATGEFMLFTIFPFLALLWIERPKGVAQK